MIAVVLLTCDRPEERREYARRTLRGLDGTLRCSTDEFWIHIADDGSEQSFRDEMIELARNQVGENTSVSNSEARGYGASYNLATQQVHPIADLILPLEDDWEVVREIDLDSIVAVLRAGVFSCVRMGYIGYTGELRAKFVYQEGKQWLELDPDSTERHVFSGGPRLETVEFERRLGLWPEGMSAGLTELEVASRPESRIGVAWPIDMVGPRGDLFTHIGTKQAGGTEAGSIARMQAGTPA